MKKGAFYQRSNRTSGYQTPFPTNPIKGNISAKY